MVYILYNKLIEVSYLYNLEITTLADKFVIGILNDKINIVFDIRVSLKATELLLSSKVWAGFPKRLQNVSFRFH